MRALFRVLPAVTVVVLGWIVCYPTTVRPQERPRNVLTIHTGAEDFPANPILDASIRRALASPPELPITYFAEYLEAERFSENDASVALGEYVRLKYRDRHIDLVIAITRPALKFVLDRRDTLFPNAPVVFAGLAVPDEATRRAGAGVAAVSVGSAYANTLKLALQLHPSTERVFVIANAPNQQNVEAVREDLRLFARELPLIYVTEETVPRMLAAVAAVPPRSLILHLWHQEPPPGHGINPEEIARLVARAAPVPVYGVIDANIGSGIVGGVVRGTEETGLRVGDIARQVLAGARAQDIPVENAPRVPTFDWRQLQRWKIESSQLPPGSVIRFKVPTVWETYRGYLIGIIIVIAGQLLLITGLLAERSSRRRAEQTIRAREATLRLSFERIRQLAGRLINAQEAARAQIARDLHDDVCQDLVGVSIALRGLSSSSGQLQDAGTQHALSHLHRWALGIADSLRRLSHELHPAALQLLGLSAALKAHCIEVEKRYDVQVLFTSQGEIGDMAPDVALCLFRIAQEALRNGAVHGDARRLRVMVARSEDHLELSVTDDGCGFDLEAVRRDGRGLGLVSVEERAHLVGGDVHIVTAPNQGTMILVRVPIGETRARHAAAAKPAFATPPLPSRRHP